MANRPNVTPPRPDLIRQPQDRFGWLDDRLLRQGWLARLGPEATAVLVLLALAADRHGASFYSRQRMAQELGLARQNVDQALARLVQLRLVDHRPWRPGHADGVWQILPVPQTAAPARPQTAASVLPRTSLPAGPQTSRPPGPQTAKPSGPQTSTGVRPPVARPTPLPPRPQRSAAPRAPGVAAPLPPSPPQPAAPPRGGQPVPLGDLLNPLELPPSTP